MKWEQRALRMNNEGKGEDSSLWAMETEKDRSVGRGGKALQRRVR